MTEILRFDDKIVKVEERMKQEWVTGVGDKAAFKFTSVGYFIVFDSGYNVGVGPEKPSFNVGDTVRHTIEKV